MKNIYMALTGLMLLGLMAVLPACKGATGPAGATGAPGTPYTPPAPLCDNPTLRGISLLPVNTPGIALSAHYMRAIPVTIATPTTAISGATHLSSFLYTGAGQLRMAIYNSSAGEPYRLVVQSKAQTVSLGSWTTVPFEYDVLLPTGVYWVTFLASEDMTMTYSGTGGTGRIAGNGWSEFPPAFPTATPLAFQYGSYINTCP